MPASEIRASKESKRKKPEVMGGQKRGGGFAFRCRKGLYQETERGGVGVHPTIEPKRES